MNGLDEIQQYQYLWDGSQPGWVLTRLCGSHVDLSLTFGSAGPSNQELMALRRTISDYKSLPLSQVAGRLRGSRLLSLGRFEPKEARTLTLICRQEGLNVVEEIVDAPKYLLTNEITKMALVIEDDELAEAVRVAALRHGVVVRNIEQ